jgi:hypothetical protein
MPLAKITGQGLSLIAVAVVLLWGCLIGEKLTLQHAQAEYARVMRDVRKLRYEQQRVPVSVPLPFKTRPVRPLAG